MKERAPSSAILRPGAPPLSDKVSTKIRGFCPEPGDHNDSITTAAEAAG